MTAYLGTATGTTPGLEATSNIPTTPALKATHTAGGNAADLRGDGATLYAQSTSTTWPAAYIDGGTTGRGVYAQGGEYGVSALATGTNGYAVNASATGTSGYAVYASATTGTSGVAVYGVGRRYGCWGVSDRDTYAGVRGRATGSSAYGLFGECTDPSSGWGVYGSGATYGVSGSGTTSTSRGVHGQGFIGVSCTATISGGTGVQASGYGVGGQAGWFSGNVNIQGTLTKSGGSFLIDHPLDPANAYLEHSFVESPDRKNIYDGIGTADANGELTVALPRYFDALNREFRYLLTPLGASAPELHIKEEFKEGTFVIAGAAPGQRICWQMTGVRKDAFAESVPLVVEREKPENEKGRFLHPELFGKSRKDMIGYDPSMEPMPAPAMASEPLPEAPEAPPAPPVP